MVVQWYKWIIDMLPVRLRQNRIIALCSVLTTPIQCLYDDFISWRRTMRVKSGASPQVCILKRIIQDELNEYVEIKEGNGVPVDFIVETDFTDVNKERRLFAILDRYKLAGKSYGYENASVSFFSEWSKQVCELAEYSTEWTNGVCELTGKPDNRIFLRYSSPYIYIKTEFTPKSKLKVVFSDNEGNQLEATVIDTQEVGYNWDNVSSSTAITATPVPDEDTNFKYVVVWQ